MTPRFVYREHAPTPPLRARVACYWTLEADASLGHRVLPDGCMDLLFDLEGAAPPGVVGVMSEALVTPAAARVRMLGVRFRPGEAFGFVPFTAADARDRLVPLDDAWGPGASSLGARLAALPTTRARTALLDATLLARAARPADFRLRRAVRAIFAARGAVRVGALAAQVGVGERHLERLFVERVGVGPKALARVARVQASSRRSTPAAIGRAPRPTSAGAIRRT